LKRALEGAGARVVGPAPTFGDAPEHGPLLGEWLRLIGDGTIQTRRLLTNDGTPQEGALNLKRLAAGVKSICGVVIRWNESPNPADEVS
jgi:hypothetical protein